MKLYYTVYKTTNIVTGKIYIGKHQTSRPNDRYLGSGKAILAAIKKYGPKNFTKEVLFIFETEQEMNDKEKEIVTADFIATEYNYNKGIGGEGGAHFKGKRHTEETKQKISLKGKGQTYKLPYDPKRAERMKLVWLNPEYRAHISMRRKEQYAKKRLSYNGNTVVS